MTLEVHRTLNDLNRRKSNVVVSGLPEQSSISDDNKPADAEAFIRLCEEHLSIKPALGHRGCKRLGKLAEHAADQTSRPRLLKVHLRSEDSVSQLLAAAKQLRRSDDQYVAENVYINPDMSPAESKLAYEDRKRRRLNLRQDRELTSSQPARHSSDTRGTGENNNQLQQQDHLQLNDRPATSSFQAV